MINNKILFVSIRIHYLQYTNVHSKRDFEAQTATSYNTIQSTVVLGEGCTINNKIVFELRELCKITLYKQCSITVSKQHDLTMTHAIYGI